VICNAADCDYTGDDLPAHALETGHALCECGWSLRDTEPRTCGRCVRRAGELLAGVVCMFAELPEHLGHLRVAMGGGTRPADDGRPLPGGDVLVLMSWGSEGLSDNGETIKDTDPPSVAAELGYWAAEWSERRGQPQRFGLSPARVVLNASQYLTAHTRWAADTHPFFTQYHSDLRALHARLERATGRFIAPEKANAECFDCSGKLVRLVDERTGLASDDVTCRDCERAYSPAAYQLALRHAWEAVEAWVEQATAARLSGRALNVIGNWIARGHVQTDVQGGKTLVWWPDVQARTRRSA
jgi:hypothetical protein